MEEKPVAPAGSFCWNEACPDDGHVGKGRMGKSGRTDKGGQRSQWKPGKKTWTETKGTLFYRCRHSPQTIVECLAMVGDRTSVAAIPRVKGVKEETVCQWVERAVTPLQQFEDPVLGPCKRSPAHLDAPLDRRRPPGRKRGRQEGEHRGTFWVQTQPR